MAHGGHRRVYESLPGCETECYRRCVLDRLRPIVELGVRRLAGRKSPYQMTLSLTNRCNFRCEYCDLPLNPLPEMSGEEWCGAIDELHGGGMGRVSLIGGEPLIFKQSGMVIRHLKKRGIHAAMNTNGWFVRDQIDDVELLDVVCITLDGPREIHDRQRHPGSYDRAIEAIEILKSRGVAVVTMTVLTPAGADNMDHVLAVARDMSFKAFLQLEHPSSADCMMPMAPRMTDERISDLAKRLLALKDAGEPIGNSRGTIQLHIDNGRYLGTCDGCYAGQYYGYILSDGTVCPCLLTHRQAEAGNGRRLGFLEAFHQMPPPRGPGCSCVPTFEVNQILNFDVGVLWNALDMTLRRRDRARV